MATIKPRDQQGKIITNISSRQLTAGVNRFLPEIDLHNWDCWNCKKIYDLEPEPGKLQNCPYCGEDPTPF